MPPDRWATFDCYGTLIDWMGGIRATLSSLWPDVDAQALLSRYHDLEPTVQAGRGIAYRTVMAETLSKVATAEGVIVPTGRDDALGASLPTWPFFPEVPGSLSELRARGWKLGILSNTDGDFLEASLTAIGVPVIAVPLPVTGGPLGLQIAASWGRDDALVQLAAQLETLVGVQ